MSTYPDEPLSSPSPAPSPAPSSQPMRAAVLERERVEQPVEPGDHERFAHYVFPKSKVLESALTGEPVTALCGKVWVPSRDPQRFPVCPACKEIYESIPAGPGGGDGDGGSD